MPTHIRAAPEPQRHVFISPLQNCWVSRRKTQSLFSDAATYLFFCVSALAATDLASLDAVLLFKIFAAADATDLPVVSFAVFDCVIADAATDFSSFDAVLLFITLAAADETFELVLPDFAMAGVPFVKFVFKDAPKNRPKHARFAVFGLLHDPHNRGVDRR